MKLINPKQAWHDAFYNNWNSPLSQIAIGTIKGTKEDSTGKAAHMSVAGRVQSVVAGLPEELQTLGHFMFAPIESDSEQAVKKAQVKALLAKRFMKKNPDFELPDHAKAFDVMLTMAVEDVQEFELRSEYKYTQSALYHTLSLPKRSWFRKWRYYFEEMKTILHLAVGDALTPVSLLVEEVRQKERRYARGE